MWKKSNSRNLTPHMLTVLYTSNLFIIKSEIDPVAQAEIYKNQGNDAYKSGNYRQAIELYSKAIELCPNSASYYGNRAAAYLMIYKYKEAISDSKISTSLDPKFAKGYMREGKSHLCLGDYAAALRAFEKLKEVEPKNTSIDVDV